MEEKKRILELAGFAHFVAALRNDMIFFFDFYQSDDSQIIRRSCVRSSFSFVEGCIHRMSKLVLNAETRHELCLNVYEKCILLESAPGISNGIAKSKPVYYPLKDRLRLIMDLFVKYAKLDIKIKYSDSGWRDLIDSIKVRDRITHPKIIEDYNVTAEELKTLAHGIEWFVEHMFDIATTKANSFDNIDYAI